MSVFRAYDIRGIYGKELTENLLKKIGRAFAEYFEDYNAVGIGIDGRTHSTKVKEFLIEGLTNKLDVIDFGYFTTPAAHYIALVYQIPVLMITASHNPPEYNGIKPIHLNGEDLSFDELKYIEKLTNQVKVEDKKEGKVEEDENALQIYKTFIKRRFKGIKSLNIGFDPGNAVGIFLKDVLEDLGNNVVTINDKLDGTFPSHLPDPSRPENLKQLINLVKEKNLDVGFALDGDGDRVGTVTKDFIFTSDKILLSFMKKGKKYVAEVSLPIYLEKVFEENGCKLYRSKTGRTNVKIVAKDVNAIAFGEYSGHLGFKEYSYIDDGLYTFLNVIKELRRKNIWFEDIEKLVPKFTYIRKEIPIKEGFIERIKEYALKNNLKIREIDGIEVFFKYGRILARPSNTEPIIRIVIESYEEGKEKELEGFVKHFI